MDLRDDTQPAAAGIRVIRFLGASFIVLTISASTAMYRRSDDPATVLFVVVSYVAALLLVPCVHAYGRATPAGKGRIRAAVWFLCSLFILVYARRVAAMAPHWSISLLIWAISAAAPVSGFLGLLLRPARDVLIDVQKIKHYVVLER
ncbi:hypothetical protein HU200_035803 [Digitaria exilis]|uniref:Uncharacterized protein n=1 Tax=Digitaria exilis TaxID=1010633 RepID=A0A835EMP2_9POAL|nr:hypothetical protein HU200_035803 [Digitaria exilis]